MPNARTHDFITIVTGAAGAPAALNMGLPDMSPNHAIVLLTAYMASGLLFSPDLDLRSSPYKRWRGMRWVWLPYQRLVPHRSWVSHSLLFGPLIRVLYFAVIMSLLTLIVLGLLNLFVPVDPTGTAFKITSAISQWVEMHPIVVVYTAIGFVLGGAVHTIADVISTKLKKLKI